MAAVPSHSIQSMFVSELEANDGKAIDEDEIEAGCVGGPTSSVDGIGLAGAGMRGLILRRMRLPWSMKLAPKHGSLRVFPSEAGSFPKYLTTPFASYS